MTERTESTSIHEQHLEEDGWTFIRYIDEVPNKEQLINKIKEILNERIS